MDVEMVQYPVGQGGLFCGTLTSGKEKFRWVYDCGSMNKQERDKEIIKVSKEGDIDILFLSHMDSDHVNGVANLLQRCQVTTVVIPYMGIRQRFAALATYYMQDPDDGDRMFVEFNRDVRGWFSEQGVEQVVRVRYGGAGGDFRGLEPYILDDDGELKNSEYDVGGTEPIDEDRIDGDEVLDVVLVLEDERIPLSGEASMSEEDEALSCKLITVDQDMKIEIKFSRRGNAFFLIPYSHRPDSKRMSKFWNKMRAFLGAKNVGSVIKANASPNTFRSFKTNYLAIWKDHNLVSMSLYCGPGINRGFVFMLKGNNFERYTTRGGWILTGDAKLSGRMRINKFLNHYKDYIPQVSVLMMPHHGSSASFASSLLSPFWGQHLCYAAAEPPPNRYNHPGQSVRDAVRRGNKYFRTVGTAVGSRFKVVGKV